MFNLIDKSVQMAKILLQHIDDTTIHMSRVRNAGATTFTHKRINTIAGNGVMITVGEDVRDDEIDVTITSTDVSQEVPTGAINGSNLVYTFVSAANPVTSMRLMMGGSECFRRAATGPERGHYAHSGLTATFEVAPVSGVSLWGHYKRLGT